MGKFAEINRTHNVKLEDLKKIMIDTFRKEESIGDGYIVDLRFNLGSVGGRGVQNEYTAVTGATFIVTKKGNLKGLNSQWEDC